MRRARGQPGRDRLVRRVAGGDLPAGAPVSVRSASCLVMSSDTTGAG